LKIMTADLEKATKGTLKMRVAELITIIIMLNITCIDMAKYIIPVDVSFTIGVDVEAESVEEAIELVIERLRKKEISAKDMVWHNEDYDVCTPDFGSGTYVKETDRERLVKYLAKNIEFEEWVISKALDDFSKKYPVITSTIECELTDCIEGYCCEFDINPESVPEAEDIEILEELFWDVVDEMNNIGKI